MTPPAVIEQSAPKTWGNRQIDAVLVLVAIIWGSTFLVVKDAVQVVGPLTFLFLRFSIAALTLALLFHKHLRHLTRAEIIAGSVIGVFAFGGYSLQTVGLQYTTASKAGFITGLYVPLVPLFSVWLLRQGIGFGAMLGVLLSVAGLAFLSFNNDFDFQFGVGEWLVLGCAFSTALHIVTISRFVPKAEPLNLAMVQIVVTALLSLLLIPVAHEPLKVPNWPVWGSALFMGTIATAFPLGVMNIVQRFVSSTRATLIYALEPVFAGLFGYLAGESLSLPGWVGCALIFLGMICSELKFPALSRSTKELKLDSSSEKTKSF